MKDMHNTTSTIPADHLVIAPENPRSDDEIDFDRLDDLAANILTMGVLSPLIGYMHDDQFFVVAGGRRTRAIQRLIENGEFSPEAEIPVSIVERSEAEAAGVAEQLSHVKMGDLDELRVYGLPQFKNASDAELAAIIGKSEKAVKQRRAVLSLPQEALDLIYAGSVTVDQGFGLTYFMHDTEHFADMLDRCIDNPRIDLNDLRREFERSCTEWSRCKYTETVTREEYLASGGELQADLFADAEFILSMGLLKQLVADQAPSILEREYPDAAFIEPLSDDAGAHTSIYNRMHHGVDELTREEREEWRDIRFDKYGRDRDEEPEWFARYDDLEARAERSYPEGLLRLLGVQYEIAPHASRGIRVFEHVLPDDLEPLYAAGYLDRPAPLDEAEGDDGESAAPESDPLPKRVLEYVANVRVHTAQMELIKKPQNAMMEYLDAINRSVNFCREFSPTIEREYAHGMPELTTSKQWDEAMKNDRAEGDGLTDLKPAQLHALVALKMLQRMTTSYDGARFQPKIREYFTPDVAFFKMYRKPQLVEMAVETNLLDNDAMPGKYKVQALAEMLTHYAAEHKHWLPMGFSAGC